VVAWIDTGSSSFVPLGATSASSSRLREYEAAFALVTSSFSPAFAAARRQSALSPSRSMR
jgi:hypothetical protein